MLRRRFLHGGFQNILGAILISSFAFSVPRRKIAAVIFSLLLLSPLNVAYGQTADPWENTNRTLFRFNDYFDTLLVKPIATTYLTLLPSVPRRVVRNFFSNIDDVNVAVNDLLQFKFDAALSDSGRILINTTVGLLGVIDVATSVGLEKNEEDFGQTFAYWGVPSGPYLVIPTKGPSSVRDAVGFVLDTLFNPLQYSDAYASRSLLYLLREIDYRSSVLALDELMFGDKYIFVREAHIQRREYLVADGLLEDVFADF